VSICNSGLLQERVKYYGGSVVGVTYWVITKFNKKFSQKASLNTDRTGKRLSIRIRGEGGSPNTNQERKLNN